MYTLFFTVYCYLNYLYYRSSLASPDDNENTQIMLYDSVDGMKQPDQMDTADNPQYGETMKQSDSTSNPKSNDNVYSYAIP